MLTNFLRVIHTNHSFKPHRLILIYREEKGKLTEALAKRIQHELRQAHLNAMETDMVVESAKVPYTIIISRRTLSDGVLYLQHYSPKIKEEVHVSNLTEKILQQTNIFVLRRET